jgi:glycosyltransferase involved in cell wall biosynthesis
MAAYNSERFVADALDSILSQTFQDFEVVVVDDGSMDSTGEILERYAERDKRVRVVHQKNAGVAAARNCAIALARGRYVAQQDHDDLSLPERLEKQIAFLEAHPETCAVFCRCVMTDERLKPLLTILAPEDDEGLRRGFRRGNPLLVNYMIRRETLKEMGSYRDAFELANDFDFNLRLLERGKVHCLPEVLYVYRSHDEQESIVRKADVGRFGALVRIFAVERALRGRDSYPEFEKMRDVEKFVSGYEFRSSYYFRAGRSNLNKLKMQEARKYLRLAVRESKRKFRPRLALAKSYLPRFVLKALASVKIRFIRSRWTRRVPSEVAEWLRSQRQRASLPAANRDLPNGERK